MHAIHLYGQGGPEGLVYEDAPQPHPSAGEVVVRVSATGVTPTELMWPTTYRTPSGSERTLPIPGHDLSGVIAEIGPGVTNVKVGEEVYGLTDFIRDGAEAEYTIALPDELAPKPRSLDFLQAAVVPLPALTAWQALFDHAGLSAGKSVLIHGAADGVGIFAVQLARWADASVIGTASAHDRELLRKLGANEIIDYTATRFEDRVHDVDIVLDTVGGETLARSWKVLKKGGVLVSTVSPPPSEEATAHGVRSAWFIVKPNRDQLIQIGGLIDMGQIHPIAPH